MAGDDGAPEPGGLNFRDPTEARGFTTLPNWLFRKRGISPAAKLLYGLLLSYAWQDDHCWPGQKRLAGDLDVTDRTIRTWLTELVSARLVTIERRGLAQTNLYWIEPMHQVGAEACFRSVRKHRAAPERKQASGHEKKTQLRTHRDEQAPLRESYERFVQQ